LFLFATCPSHSAVVYMILSYPTEQRVSPENVTFCDYQAVSGIDIDIECQGQMNVTIKSLYSHASSISICADCSWSGNGVVYALFSCPMAVANFYSTIAWNGRPKGANISSDLFWSTLLSKLYTFLKIWT